MIMIVGGDGKLGSALAARLRDLELPFIATSRRAGAKYYLDLRDVGQVARFRPRAAILCAAETSISACRDNPTDTRLVNVEGNLALARQLAAGGCFVIGLSSNRVFDGSSPQVPSSARRCPTSTYGWQKAELERGLFELGELGCVFRLTKVITPAMPLFESWRSDLGACKEIHPFRDMSFSPIPLELVVAALIQAVQAARPGIFQLSAADDIGYAEAAKQLAAIMNIDESLVQASTSPEPMPKYTSLDTSRAERELGWQTMSAAETLDIYFDA